MQQREILQLSSIIHISDFGCHQVNGSLIFVFAKTTKLSKQ